jgi:hypothetical protein
LRASVTSTACLSDTNFGWCRTCGSDPAAHMSTEEGVRKWMGWQMITFCESRFDPVRSNLKPEQQVRWGRLSRRTACRGCRTVRR